MFYVSCTGGTFDTIVFYGCWASCLVFNTCKIKLSLKKNRLPVLIHYFSYIYFPIFHVVKNILINIDLICYPYKYDLILKVINEWTIVVLGWRVKRTFPIVPATKLKLMVWIATRYEAAGWSVSQKLL